MSGSLGSTQLLANADSMVAAVRAASASFACFHLISEAGAKSSPDVRGVLESPYVAGLKGLLDTYTAIGEVDYSECMGVVVRAVGMKLLSSEIANSLLIACGATWVVVRVPVLNLRRGRKGHIAPAAHDVAPSYDDLLMAYN